MKITLPDDGSVFLVNVTNSWLLIIVLLLLSTAFLASFFERKKLYNPVSVFPTIKWYHLLLGFLGWMLIELLASASSLSLRSELILLLRNLAAIAFGFILPVWIFGNQNLSSRDILGRIRPFGQFFLLGSGVFLVLGLAFWGFSFFRPFQVKLASKATVSESVIIQSVFVVGLIPLTEEILFRFLLYGYLRRHLGRILGILGSSVVFASLHGFVLSTVAIFVGAVLMTILVEVTQSIIPSLVLHGGFNFLITFGSFWV